MARQAFKLIKNTKTWFEVLCDGLKYKKTNTSINQFAKNEGLIKESIELLNTNNNQEHVKAQDVYNIIINMYRSFDNYWCIIYIIT